MEFKKSFAGIIGILLFVMALQSVSAVSETISFEDYVVDFEYDQEDVEAGETFRLSVTITNEAGETRDNIEISLDLDDPFDEVGDDVKNLGTLNDDESKSVSFRIEVEDNANEGEYDIDFDLKDNKIDESDDFSVDVESNKAELIIGDIESVPSVISPDSEDIKLKFVLENTGDEDAEFVRVKLGLPAGFEPSGSYSDIASLGTILKGKNKEVEFFVDSDEFIDSGLHVGKLEISYESDNDNEIDILSFDLPVKGRPQFIVQNSRTEPGVIVAGDGGELRITIENIGKEEGKETSVRVFENSDQPFEYNEKTNFIGSMKPGESGTGVITFSVDGDAKPNTYLVRAQVRTVSEGNVLVEEITIPVKIEKAEGSNLWIFVLIGVVFVLLIVLVLYLTK